MLQKNHIKATMEYEIVKEIAAGGMGSVCKAKLKGVAGFEKVVAIKTLLEKFSKDKSFVERFIDEAKLVANLVHENIVQIYQLERTGDVYYFVLEYVDGIGLYELMEFHRMLKKTMPVPLAVFIASRVARGLNYAHTRTDGNGKPLNIVHCDICPHNVMINSEGVPKLTDFGIARAVTMKALDSVSGKLAFMSPEQAYAGARVDFRSDLYSLGLVLFYLLSGGQYARNLTGTQAEVLARVQANEIRWELLPTEVPDDLLALLKRMLATLPAERYATTDELARDLEYYIYKDGYGPTIVTLAKYLRELMPGRFVVGGDQEHAAPGKEAETVPEYDHTVVIQELDKTIQLTPEELDAIGRQ